jgi:hypothetical protein
MAEKSAKKKPKKAADASVLGTLSATRPTRLGGDRRATTTRTRAAAGDTSATSASPRATSAKPKAAPKRTSAPKQAEAKAAKLRKPAPAPPAGWQTPGEEPRRRGGRASGTEIVTTAVQAAGELTQLGVAIGGQLLKRAAGRIPRP